MTVEKHNRGRHAGPEPAPPPMMVHNSLHALYYPDFPGNL